MGTRTHTVFFTQESLKPIKGEYEKLSDDYGKRAKYMSTGAQYAYEQRLLILSNAIKLLAEPVSESL